MALTSSTIVFVAFILLCFNSTNNAQAKNHHQHKKHPKYTISIPPAIHPIFESSPNQTNSTNSPPIPPPIPIPSPPSPSPFPSPSPSPPPSPSPAPSPSNSPVPHDDFYAYSLFDVMVYGAIGDGVSDDTKAFKTAWDSACQKSNPSMIFAPKGYSFLLKSIIFTGPCRKNMIFQLEGTILAPEDPHSWPANSRRNWLVFYKTDGLTFQGSGLIDGRGEKWWNLPCKPHKGINGTTMPGPCDSPVALRFFSCSNVTVQGLRVHNSPQFHFRFDECRYVTVNKLTINSPALSPNTDGIHVEATQNVLIHNSVIANGDDCVSIGGGTLNIHIENITCGPGHGISIGSLGKQNSRACVANVTVKNAIIKHSDNGVRIKTWQGGSGSVSAVTFDKIQMDTVRNPIIIDQYYCISKACQNQTSNLFVTGVTYSNIKGTYDVRSPPMHFGCSDSVPCTNITMSEVELVPATGETKEDPFCWNVYGTTRTHTIPPVPCFQEGLPRFVMDIDNNRCY